MFTGIIEELGTITSVHPEDGGGVSLAIRGPLVTGDARRGDSICVSGACLTVVDRSRGDQRPGDGEFCVDVMPETLRRTAIGTLGVGSRVNLERSVRADARLHGHIVQGHVDGVGELTERRDEDGWIRLEVRVPDALAGLVAEKGSVALNGVSLTVTHVDGSSLGVALIPETLRVTNLGLLAVGDPVNIEVDVLARYVARLLEVDPARAGESPAEGDDL
ncbi:riboflavin synthase [Brooklawnia cerclae]|uniref:Riboflavin synthase n=1 Tax=Brooklawnia cerclae TaxID=349934 RepID=A0ABX0SIE5_9ACTN|nr:riboflavin synthase [Brooklawnia cerclae]NIH56526.1 riboflavin synthase [Brooklawnia cerclae]